MAQAVEVCEDFEDLIDTELQHDDILWLIDGVLVCPYGEEERRLFFEQYMESKDAEAALAMTANEGYSAMLLLSEADDEHHVAYMDIAAYLKEKGVHYNVPE